MLTWVAIVTRSVVIAQSNMATGVNVYCGEDLEDKRSTCFRAHCDRSRQRKHDQQWPDEHRHFHVRLEHMTVLYESRQPVHSRRRPC